VFDRKVRRLCPAGDTSASNGINRDPVALVSARAAQIKRVLERAANRAAAGGELLRRTRHWVDATTELRLRDQRTGNGEVHLEVPSLLRGHVFVVTIIVITNIANNNTVYASRSRQAVNSSLRFFNRFSPKCPNCSRWTACTGPSSRPTRSSPADVIRTTTVRRSLVSREREINPRLSSRSSSRVISGSRAISRFPISPQESPAGSPRTIRSTLYWGGDRSSFFRVCDTLRDRISVVRTSSRNVDSSRPPLFVVLRRAITNLLYSLSTNIGVNKYLPIKTY
jgi:hypothetical protein